MNNFIALGARSHVRNAVLCGLLTVALAACGAGQDSSSSGSSQMTSDSLHSLVSPSLGVIDRTGSNDSGLLNSSAAVPAPGATTTASSVPTASPLPAAGATASSGTTAPSSGTSIATSGKTAPKPVSPPTVSSGTTTLDWMPPTENNDGTVLTDLAGYTVYYGTSPTDLTQSVKITNPGLTAYTMSNLASGKWYFAVSAYSTTGAESARSGVVSTTI